MLVARTIRTKDNIGSIDIALNRPDPKYPPTNIYSAHIEGEEGVISEGVIGSWNTFNELFRIKYCRDICIEYDGSWKKNLDNVYTYYTVGDPYIAYIEHDDFLNHKLKVQNGQSTSTLISQGNITCISMVRGWRNIATGADDQGLIIAYVRDGNLYYRSLVSENNVVTWVNEEHLSVVGSNVKSINLTRTNDYRVIFHGQLISGEHYMAYSERCWAGFAVEPEEVYHSMEINQPNISHINILSGECKDQVNNNMYINDITVYYVKQPYNILCSNQGNTTLKLQHNTNIAVDDLNLARSNIIVTDEKNKKFAIGSIDNFNNYSILTVSKFNNAVGNITVSYNGLGGLKLMNNESVNEFSVTFTPYGLIPEVVIPPKLVHLININNNGGYYEK